jgi:hypothetical protein
MKPMIRFYRQLKQALFVRDVYAPMFFCDFINMIIVIGFYSQFGVSIVDWSTCICTRISLLYYS